MSLPQYKRDQIVDQFTQLGQNIAHAVGCQEVPFNAAARFDCCFSAVEMEVTVKVKQCPKKP